jgi:hypothetical protein
MGLSSDDLVEHPTNRYATGISALNAKTDDPACEHVHHQNSESQTNPGISAAFRVLSMDNG